MRLRKLAFRGIGLPFRGGEVEIDFEDLGPGLIALVGSNGCLSGDTLIDVPRDLVQHPAGMPIRDLVGTEPLVYAYDTKAERISLARARNVRITARNQPVLRLRFTSSSHGRFSPPKEIVGTPDHPVMLRDGAYKALAALRPGDRLMPLYRRCRDGKYVWLNMNDGTFELEHRLVAGAVRGACLRPNEQAHHRDRNTFNNAPDNLDPMDCGQHAALHASEHPPTYTQHPRGMAGKRHTTQTRQRIGATVRTKQAMRPEIHRRRLDGVRRYWASRDRPWTDGTLLRRLYVDEALSTVQISSNLGVSDTCVGSWLKRHGIRVRSMSEAAHSRHAAHGANHVVVSVEPAGRADVYDLEVPGHSNFVANGVVVHNSGKSHVLEMSGYGTLFREFASYGRESLTSHVPTGVRDARTALEFALGGRIYRVLVQIDPLGSGGRGKVEAYLSTDGTGIAGPGVREVDDALARLLPTRQWWLSSVFAAQATAASRTGASFWALSKAERKALFGEMLGLGHLQELAVASRDRAQAELRRLDMIRANGDRLRADVARHEALTAEIVAAEAAEAALQERCAAMSAQAVAAEAGAAEAVDRLSRVDAARDSVAKERQRLSAELHTALAERDTTRARLDSLDALRAERDSIEQAVRRVPEIDADLEGCRALQSTYRAQIATCAATVARQEASVAQCEDALTRDGQVRKDAALARDRLPRLDRLEAEARGHRDRMAEIAARLPEIERQRPACQARVDEERDRAENVRRLRDRQRDLTARKDLLDRVPGVPACATCPLTADARAAGEQLAGVTTDLNAACAQDGAGGHAALEALLTEQAQLNRERAEIDVWTTQHAADLASTEHCRVTAATLDGVTEQIAVSAQRLQEALSALEETRRALARHEADVALVEGQLADLLGARRGADGLAQRAPALAAAQAQAVELEAALVRLDEEIGSAATASAHLTLTPGLLDDDEYAATVTQTARLGGEAAAAKARLREIEKEAHDAAVALANLGGQRSALGEPASALTALLSQERTYEQAACDWSLLEQSLGRDGVQALEISAAGPTVTALANDLLSSCLGGRFQLAIETTAQSKDRKKQLEVFDLRILDGALGRTQGVLASGGEMVLLDEALRLALALFNAGQSGFQCETLWRDETAGQLSPANAQHYVAMVRRAMGIGHFHQCLFISHSPEVWEQADARLFVEDGAVRLG